MMTTPGRSPGMSGGPRGISRRLEVPARLAWTERLSDIQPEFGLLARSGDADRQLRAPTRPSKERLRDSRDSGLPAFRRFRQRGIEQQVTAEIKMLTLQVVRAGNPHNRARHREREIRKRKSASTQREGAREP